MTDNEAERAFLLKAEGSVLDMPERVSRLEAAMQVHLVDGTLRAVP